MRRALLMPKLGLTMTEGVMVEWLVPPGAAFKQGQSLFVIESEKAAVEVPADFDGVLLESVAKPGDTLPVGEVIGWWKDAPGGADAPSSAPASAAPATPATAPAAQVAATPTPAVAAPAGARLIATPLARRIAQQRGVDLRGIQGSGPRGRIRAADVPAAGSNAGPAPVAQPQAQAAVPAQLRNPSATEATIAQRLVAAKQQTPHFYLSSEVEVSRLMALRAEINAAQSGVKLTLNDFLLAAVGRALVDLPQHNRVWTDEGILSLSSPDVGMAVNTARGLLVGVVRNAGAQPVSAISRSAKALIEKARAGRLGAADMSGGAITVSNAGMHDVTAMASIINPGQAMILGVGSVRELFRPDSQGAPLLHREITLVLSADHRVLDGVSAAEFLKRIRAHLSHPLGLMVA